MKKQAAGAKGIQLFPAMNKENKKQDKIGLSLQKKHFLHRRRQKRRAEEMFNMKEILNNKKRKEISIWNALYAL